MLFLVCLYLMSIQNNFLWFSSFQNKKAKQNAQLSHIPSNFLSLKTYITNQASLSPQYVSLPLDSRIARLVDSLSFDWQIQPTYH